MALDREKAVVGSALWSAAGDALGWITELGDEDTIRHRTGDVSVSKTVDWRRRIGGRFGPTVRLPAGTYSDDTQLRLAVCRAIGPTGAFDAEAFAKVELPVWSNYSLGAGRGTSAAAANLAKNSVNWFNNFFSVSERTNYFVAGGNGAAMRIQPHVWKADTSSPDTFLPDVLRDAVITHGHPKGIGGAVFHALCVAHALSEGKSPGPDDWLNFVEHLHYCQAIIRSDDKLGLFWLNAWEARAGLSLEQAFEKEIETALDVIAKVSDFAGDPARYEDALEVLGCRDDSSRGAGLGTAIAAAVVANYVDVVGAQDALIIAANALNSDTDTIASMAGAIFGSYVEDMPWEIQDRGYIVAEAKRMAAIGHGERVKGFVYPDLMSWTPPTTQSDGVGMLDGSLFLAGLGRIIMDGQEYETSDAIWQWGILPFGQTVLTKRRRSPRALGREDVAFEPIPTPLDRSSTRPPSPPTRPRQPDFFAANQTLKAATREGTARRTTAPDLSMMDLDDLTSLVIDNGFPEVLIGKVLLMLAGRAEGIEQCIAFSAIISKAIRSRRRRS